MLLQDARYAMRTLWRSPSFTMAAVAALALGISASTAMFSVVDGVLLRPLPFPDSERIVQVLRTFPQGKSQYVSLPLYALARAHAEILDDIAAYDAAGPGVTLGSGGNRPEQLKAIRVSGNYFALFRARPVIGRTFAEEEDRPGGPHAVVVSHRLWRQQLGADQSVIGRTVLLNGEPHPVIGVLDPGFQPYPPADVWVPLQADPNSTNLGNFLLLAGRIKSGQSLSAARAQIQIVAQAFRRQYPDAMGESDSLDLVTLQTLMTGDVVPVLRLLGGAVGLVLLIACANTANLLLARGMNRKRELAVRASLGASRLRLVRQLLTESLVLSIVAGSLGVLLGHWAVRAFLAFAPGDLPRTAELQGMSSLDPRILAFTVIASTLTGLLFGCVPALRLTRADLGTSLKAGGSRTATGHHESVRNLLVVSEVALAVVLSVGAGLLIRSLVSLQQVNPGFDSHNVVTLKTSLAGRKYGTTGAAEALTTRVVQRLEDTPGIQAAAMTVSLPFELGPDIPFAIEGRSLGSKRFSDSEQWRSVSPHYFQVLRIPLMRGRLFDERDTSSSTKVVLINDALARKHWPGADPIGQRLKVYEGIASPDPIRLVIGVVRDVRETGVGTAAPPVMYVPQAQVPDDLNRLSTEVFPVSWIVRVSAYSARLDQIIQAAFDAADPLLATTSVQRMDQVIAGSLARQRFQMLVLGIFAGAALLLATSGVYGVLSYLVAQRTPEMAVRMALGARPWDLVRMIGVYGLRLVTLGVVIGLVCAAGFTRLLTAFLFAVRPIDLPTFGCVTLVLAIVALTACAVPARRASLVDPIVALRSE